MKTVEKTPAKNAPTTAKVEVQAPATTPATGTQAVQFAGTIVAKQGVKYRGARAAYYDRLLSFNNKPLAEFVASVAASVPSTPQKGKLANKPEPITGWIAWFKRVGVLEVK